MVINGVSEDILNLSDFAAPSINFVRNPGFENEENSLEGWIAVGNTIGGTIGAIPPTLSTDTIDGSNALTIEYDARTEHYSGVLTDIEDISHGWYNISCDVSSAANDSMGAMFLISLDEGVTYTIVPTSDSSNTISSVDNYVPISSSSGTVRITGSYLHKQGSPSTVRLYFVCYNINNTPIAPISIDNVQMEPNFDAYIYGRQRDFPHSAHLTDYVDPANDRNSRWLGEVNNSISIREPVINEIHRVVFTYISDSLYVDFDRDSVVGRSIYLPYHQYFSEDIIIKERISCISETDDTSISGYVIGI